MNEINALIWPAPGGIGIMQKDAFDRTAEIAQQFGVIKEAPDDGAYRTDLSELAVQDLKEEGVDVNGADFQKAEVEVTAGGE
jgi:NitT/TauT family transport system substrate-binding protein